MSFKVYKFAILNNKRDQMPLRKKIWILYLLALCARISVEAQDEQKTKPIELPNFIIEGVENLNIGSGVKQLPKKPAQLTKAELDSINPLEKQQSLLLPLDSLPSGVTRSEINTGHFKGELGRYLTPKLEGGWSYYYKEYLFYAGGGLESSDGHIIGSDFNKLNLSLFSDYLAPEKFWIFGGSKTRSGLNFSNNNFAQFANPGFPRRNNVFLSAFIESEGNFEGASFQTGSSFRTTQINGALSSGHENYFNGWLNIDNLVTYSFERNRINQSIIIGSDCFLKVGALNSNSIYFAQVAAKGKYSAGDIIYKFKLGIQSSQGSSKSNFGVIIDASSLIPIDKNFTMRTNFRSGLENSSLENFIRYNPYLKGDAIIDFAYQKVDLKGTIDYHPNETSQYSGAVRLRVVSDYPIIALSDSLSFTIFNKNALLFDVLLEGYKYITNEDIISFSADFIYWDQSTGDAKLLPSISPVNLTIDYKHKWDYNIGTNIGLKFTGNRYADMENKIVIGGFLNVSAGIEYGFRKDLTAYLKFDNLTNSDIVIWNGYKERNLFMTLGAIWQF
ncbi:MAG: hypothetical protein HW421_683 [Ignavibacteria bacterium]|nr:hypothetical protein [Ignavibacteria bacterium]